MRKVLGHRRALEYKSILQCSYVLIRRYYGLLNLNIPVACVLKARKLGMISLHFHVRYLLAEENITPRNHSVLGNEQFKMWTFLICAVHLVLGQ